ncbi:MAG: hypothetical protein R3C11_05040 [Planctomycetaceae bacterium]
MARDPLKCVALRPRCKNAYEAYARALQTRWGGSRQEGLAFAMDCLKSDDWDLGIPQTAIDIIKELGDPDNVKGFDRGL